MDQPSAVSGRADVAVSGGEEGEADCGTFLILHPSRISSLF